MACSTRLWQPPFSCLEPQNNQMFFCQPLCALLVRTLAPSLLGSSRRSNDGALGLSLPVFLQQLQRRFSIARSVQRDRVAFVQERNARKQRLRPRHAVGTEVPAAEAVVNLPKETQRSGREGLIDRVMRTAGLMRKSRVCATRSSWNTTESPLCQRYWLRPLTTSLARLLR